MAALALSTSKTVSIMSRSAPPRINPRAASAYASASSSKVTDRAAGSATSAEIEAVLLVGPSDPATNRGRFGSRASAASAAARAIRAASTWISYATPSIP